MNEDQAGSPEISSPQIQPVEVAEWNQNSKIPKIYPGIIASISGMILFLITLCWVNWMTAGLCLIAITLSTIYWTFCVFRITGLLQYKSTGSKLLDRALALLIPLVVNPAVFTVLIGGLLALAAMIVAFFFNPYTNWLAHNSGQISHVGSIIYLCSCMFITMVPVIAVPTLCIGWTYKFIAKVALVSESLEHKTFWQTRRPAMLIALNMFVGIESWLAAGFSIGGDAPWPPSLFIAVCMIFACFAFGFCQAINFYILWRCVRGKRALAHTSPQSAI